VKLHVRSVGEGPPVVILHGLFGSSDNWQTFALQLAERGYRAVLPDLRNHGRSPHSDEHTYVAMAADLGELIRAESLSSPVLVGHSMGGKAAMLAALKDPDAVGGLVVVDMAPGPYAQDQHAVADALAGMDLAAIHNRRDADAALAERIRDPATRGFLLKNLNRKDDNTFGWRFNLEVLRRTAGAMSEGIDASVPYPKPALFIRAERSDYITEKDRPLIKKLFPAATVATAPGAGHWVHVDAPDWLLGKVVSYLAGMPGWEGKG